MEKIKLSLGISTCPNDTFIYENLVAGLPDSPFSWHVTFADVQTLNEMVLAGKLDVAKVSAQIYPQVSSGYHVLDCGGAIGYGCGPLLLSSEAPCFNDMLPTILPGKNTTASLLFKFWFSHEKGLGKSPSVKFALFNQVYQALCEKKKNQGVVIHEHRFTWKHDGLHLIQDLGAYWEERTGSPIPLGISVAKKSLPNSVVARVQDEIRCSLALAWQRGVLVTNFIREKAQIEDNQVIEDHIRMFVNDFSENVGERGKAALGHLWALKK